MVYYNGDLGMVLVKERPSLKINGDSFVTMVLGRNQRQGITVTSVLKRHYGNDALVKSAISMIAEKENDGRGWQRCHSAVKAEVNNK